MRNMYKKFQNRSKHGSKLMLCIKKKEKKKKKKKWRKEGWTDGRTPKKRLVPPNQFTKFDKVKMPKVTKGHQSWSILQNLFKS